MTFDEEEIDRLERLLLRALEALVYHRDQTRPIDKSDAVIAAISEHLEIGAMVRPPSFPPLTDGQ